MARLLGFEHVALEPSKPERVEIVAAHCYVDTSHRKGNVVITL